MALYNSLREIEPELNNIFRQYLNNKLGIEKWEKFPFEDYIEIIANRGKLTKSLDSRYINYNYSLMISDYEFTCGGSQYIKNDSICELELHQQIGIEKIEVKTESKEQKNKLPKLLILGSGRHGKDTFAEILQEYFGLKFVSSSQAAADIFIYDKLKKLYGYATPEECYNDRSNHRAEWYQMICEYNKDDRAKLAKGILELNDCYVGMRDRDEINECMVQGLFDLIIWVDASKRLPSEDASSFNIDISCADIIIDNNGTFEQFKERVLRLGKIFSK